MRACARTLILLAGGRLSVCVLVQVPQHYGDLFLIFEFLNSFIQLEDFILFKEERRRVALRSRGIFFRRASLGLA